MMSSMDAGKMSTLTWATWPMAHGGPKHVVQLPEIEGSVEFDATESM